MVYFRNHPDYLDKHPEGFSPGFATINVGRDLFWGKDLEHEKSWSMIQDKLIKSYNEPSICSGQFPQKITRDDLLSFYEVMARLDIQKLTNFSIAYKNNCQFIGGLYQ